MLNGNKESRSCSLLELSHPNIQQLQFEREQKQTNKQTMGGIYQGLGVAMPPPHEPRQFLFLTQCS